jgi:hypothetical protein
MATQKVLVMKMRDRLETKNAHSALIACGKPHEPERRNQASRRPLAQSRPTAQW